MYGALPLKKYRVCFCKFYSFNEYKVPNNNNKKSYWAQSWAITYARQIFGQITETRGDSEITLTHSVTLNPWTQTVAVYVINTHKGNPANLSHQWAKQNNAWNQGCTNNACICKCFVVIIWTYLCKGFLLSMFCLSVVSWSEQPCNPCKSLLDNPDDHICRKMIDIWIQVLMVGDWEMSVRQRCLHRRAHLNIYHVLLFWPLDIRSHNQLSTHCNPGENETHQVSASKD